MSKAISLSSRLSCVRQYSDVIIGYGLIVSLNSTTTERIKWGVVHRFWLILLFFHRYVGKRSSIRKNNQSPINLYEEIKELRRIAILRWI
jgi:hypothetical protein